MEEKLYPLFYEGKFWSEDEVNDIFRIFYHSKLSLDGRMSVYVGDDLRITPDGTWLE